MRVLARAGNRVERAELVAAIVKLKPHASFEAPNAALVIVTRFRLLEMEWRSLGLALGLY